MSPAALGRAGALRTREALVSPVWACASTCPLWLWPGRGCAPHRALAAGFRHCFLPVLGRSSLLGSLVLCSHLCWVPSAAGGRVLGPTSECWPCPPARRLLMLSAAACCSAHLGAGAGGGWLQGRDLARPSHSASSLPWLHLGAGQGCVGPSQLHQSVPEAGCASGASEFVSLKWA